MRRFKCADCGTELGTEKVPTLRCPKCGGKRVEVIKETEVDPNTPTRPSDRTSKKNLHVLPDPKEPSVLDEILAGVSFRQEQEFNRKALKSEILKHFVPKDFSVEIVERFERGKPPKIFMINGQEVISKQEVEEAMDNAYRFSITDMERHDYQDGVEPEVISVSDLRKRLGIG